MISLFDPRIQSRWSLLFCCNFYLISNNYSKRQSGAACEKTEANNAALIATVFTYSCHFVRVKIEILESCQVLAKFGFWFIFIPCSKKFFKLTCSDEGRQFTKQRYNCARHAFRGFRPCGFEISAICISLRTFRGKNDWFRSLGRFRLLYGLSDKEILQLRGIQNSAA